MELPRTLDDILTYKLRIKSVANAPFAPSPSSPPSLPSPRYSSSSSSRFMRTESPPPTPLFRCFPSTSTSEISPQSIIPLQSELTDLSPTFFDAALLPRHVRLTRSQLGLPFKKLPIMYYANPRVEEQFVIQYVRPSALSVRVILFLCIFLMAILLVVGIASPTNPSKLPMEITLRCLQIGILIIFQLPLLFLSLILFLQKRNQKQNENEIENNKLHLWKFCPYCTPATFGIILDIWVSICVGLFCGFQGIISGYVYSSNATKYLIAVMGSTVTLVRASRFFPLLIISNLVGFGSFAISVIVLGLETNWKEPDLENVIGGLIGFIVILIPALFLGVRVELLFRNLFEIEQQWDRLCRCLEEETGKQDSLMRNVIPEILVPILKIRKEITVKFRDLPVLINDIAGFTAWCSNSKAIDVISFVNGFYEICDTIAVKFRIEKVKSEGDSWCGIAFHFNTNDDDNHIRTLRNDVKRTLLTAIGMTEAFDSLRNQMTERSWGSQTAPLGLRTGVSLGLAVVFAIGGVGMFSDTDSDCETISSCSSVREMVQEITNERGQLRRLTFDVVGEAVRRASSLEEGGNGVSNTILCCDRIQNAAAGSSRLLFRCYDQRVEGVDFPVFRVTCSDRVYDYGNDEKMSNEHYSVSSSSSDTVTQNSTISSLSELSESSFLTLESFRGEQQRERDLCCQFWKKVKEFCLIPSGFREMMKSTRKTHDFWFARGCFFFVAVVSWYIFSLYLATCRNEHVMSYRIPVPLGLLSLLITLICIIGGLGGRNSIIPVILQWPAWVLFHVNAGVHFGLIAIWRTEPTFVVESIAFCVPFVSMMMPAIQPFFVKLFFSGWIIPSSLFCLFASGDPEYFKLTVLTSSCVLFCSSYGLRVYHASLQTRMARREAMEEQFQELNEECEKSDALLLSALPSHVLDSIHDDAKRLNCVFEDYQDGASLYCLISGFPDTHEMVSALSSLFGRFDQMVSDVRQVAKVKSSGNSKYICVAWNQHDQKSACAKLGNVAQAMVYCAMTEFQNIQIGHNGKIMSVSLRIGLHHGPFIAGLVGRNRWIWDVR